METKFDAENKLWLGPAIPYPFPDDVYLGEKILEALKANPKRVLQVFHEEDSELIAEDFRLSIIRVAQNLTSLGIEANDVVGISCLNCNEVCVLINACLLIGAIVNPLDVAFKKDDICHMFNQTKPKVVFCDYDIYLTMKSSLKTIGNSSKIFTIGGKIAGASIFEELLAPTGTEEDFFVPKFKEPAKEKVFGIICSSGTTGLPKGICKSEGEILAWYAFYAMRPESRSLAFSTTYWATGFYPTITLAFAVKDTRILTRQRFDIDILIELVEKRKVTSIIMPPSQLTLMIQSEKFRNCNYSSLTSIISGGSIVTDTLRKKFRETFPEIKLSISYGMSEVAVGFPLDDAEDFAVAKGIMANTTLKIVDDNGNNLGIGEKGELCVKSSFKFMGYYNQPEASAQALDEFGFFKTGDIGYLDEQNYLYIVDRKKDILKYKGFQFNPSEIESVIENIEGVELVCVVGLPDPLVTDLPTAVIVKQKGFENLTEEKIIKIVEEKLPVNKHLHGGVYFVKELPMTLSGKIKKKIVMEMIQEMKNKV